MIRHRLGQIVLVWSLLVTLSIGCARKTPPSDVSVAPTRSQKAKSIPASDAPAGYLTSEPVNYQRWLTDGQKVAYSFPLPQNPEQQKKQELERIEKYRGLYVKSFEQFSKTKDSWSPLARQALELVAKSEGVNIGRRDDLLEERAKAIQAAIEAGCDDLLVRYCSWIEKQKNFTNDPQNLKDIQFFPDQFDNRHYPLQLRLEARWWVCVTRTATIPTPTTALPRPPSNQRYDTVMRKNMLPAIDPIWPIFVEAAKARTVDLDRALLKLAGKILVYYDNSGRDRKEGFDRIEKALADGHASDWLKKVVEGHFLIEYVWDARGFSSVGKVPQSAWKVIGPRLTQATKVLTDAWEEEPTRPESATMMLEVCKLTGSPRPIMEMWFQRAMQADPANYDACREKVIILHPRWGGSNEEMFQFCYQCARTNNWDARLPIVLFHAYTDGQYYDKIDYKSPAFLNDMRELFEPRITHSPNDRFAITFYAMLSCRAERYDLADYLFRKLEKRPVLDPLTYRSFEMFVADSWRAKKENQ
ncbi:MAG: hypothetical protein U0798_07540 [Gemmataceae bacterium]